MPAVIYAWSNIPSEALKSPVGWLMVAWCMCDAASDFSPQIENPRDKGDGGQLTQLNLDNREILIPVSLYRFLFFVIIFSNFCVAQALSSSCRGIKMNVLFLLIMQVIAKGVSRWGWLRGTFWTICSTTIKDARKKKLHINFVGLVRFLYNYGS